jgi:hypothetical protein
MGGGVARSVSLSRCAARLAVDTDRFCGTAYSRSRNDYAKSMPSGTVRIRGRGVPSVLIANPTSFGKCQLGLEY